jgi:hypothetical protein
MIILEWVVNILTFRPMLKFPKESSCFNLTITHYFIWTNFLSTFFLVFFLSCSALSRPFSLFFRVNTSKKRKTGKKMEEWRIYEEDKGEEWWNCEGECLIYRKNLDTILPSIYNFTFYSYQYYYIYHLTIISSILTNIITSTI